MPPIPAPGAPPLSPQVRPEGTLFRVLSRREPTLQLYAGAADARPERMLTPERAGDHWEILVEGVGDGDLYTWSVGASDPLVDPYCLSVSGPERFGSDDPDRSPPPLPRRNREAEFKSVVVSAPPSAEWKRPNTPWNESIVYELHVRGFTRHPSAKAKSPGTFGGLAEKIDYLRDLGITAVELLPVHEFDETEVRRGEGLFNFWGYSPIVWMAPNRRYARDDPIGEFREMVRAFHAAGIQVILDVVFNHTAELDEEGPTWNLRGLDEERYYLPVNLTGCGNTVRAQHPSVRELVLDALRWWVHGMGVDGFRFDLATILSRDLQGELTDRPPLLREIETDPALESAVLVAEAWDAAGGYQVATWPGGPRWSIWNDRFRDDVRRAWMLPEESRTGALATRLAGSSDQFARFGPPRGVNYVTVHDGFTLRDAVSYSRRHNKANLEDNNDGHAHEVSANHGREGPSRKPEILARRDRARRNLVASLLLAQGVPMLLAGDEFGRTQKGNNNAYCHDSKLTWLDWTGLKKDRAFHRFVRGLVHLRRETPALHRTRFLRDEEIHWIGVEGEAVDWDGSTKAFAYLLDDLFVAVNLGGEPRSFPLPSDRSWRRIVDTAAEPPLDFFEPVSAPVHGQRGIEACERSIVVLRAER